MSNLTHKTSVIRSSNGQHPGQSRIVVIAADDMISVAFGAVTFALHQQIRSRHALTLRGALDVLSFRPPSNGIAVGPATSGTGALTFDAAAFAGWAERLDIGRGGASLPLNHAMANPLGRDLLVCIVARAPTGRAPAVRMIHRGDRLIDGDDTSPELSFEILLLEDGPMRHIPILGQLGLMTGLAPEWEVPAEAPNGDDFAALAPADPLFQRMPPNLIAHDGDATYVPSSLRALLPSPDTDPATLIGGAHDPYAENLTALFEGGAGYRANVFRCAPDCLLRRRLPADWNGAGVDPLAWDSAPDNLDYCVACTAYLRNRLIAKPRAKQTPFAEQKHHFEKISWGNGRRGGPIADTLGPGPQWTFGEGRHPETDTDDFWTYTLRLDPAAGLVLTEMRDVRRRQGSLDHNRPVADELRYRDMAATVRDANGSVNSRVPLDLGAAIAAGNYTLTFGEAGKLTAHDPLWQEGFLLRAEIEVMGLVRVTLEQSLCLRRAWNDFDPTRAVVAIKVYPELAYTWEPLVDGATVEALHGCIWINARPISEPSMQHGDLIQLPGDPPIPNSSPEENVLTTWFAETDPWENAVSINFRARSLPHRHFDIAGHPSIYHPPVGYPAITSVFYAGLFDYWLKQEHAPTTSDPTGLRGETAMEIIGVRHPADAASGRFGSYRAHNPNSLAPDELAYIEMERKTRQGQYDNVHNHGWMGWAKNPTSMAIASPPQPLRMAPVCGQACVHLHWRWLPFAETLFSAIDDSTWDMDWSYGYMGWGDDPATATSHQYSATPLIPPNQRLRIAITPVAHRRGGGASDNPGAASVLPGTTDTHGVRVSATLDISNRAIWYDVDIANPVPRGQKQVIFEQGWGYACDHAVPGALLSMTSEQWMIWAIRANAQKLGYPAGAHMGTDAWSDPFTNVIHYAYGGWMYHKRPPPGAAPDPEQIPSGEHDVNWQGTATIPMEDL